MRTDANVTVAHDGGRDEDRGSRWEGNYEAEVKQYQVATILRVVVAKCGDVTPVARIVHAIGVLKAYRCRSKVEAGGRIHAVREVEVYFG